MWESKESFLAIDGNKLTLQVSPYSLLFDGTRKAIVVRNLKNSKEWNVKTKYYFNRGSGKSLYSRKIVHSIIQGHKAIIDCLEAKTCSIIAITGEACMSVSDL